MWTVHLEGGPRRVNHAAVALGDTIFSFGGYCSGETFDPESPIDIHALNTHTYRWSLLKSHYASDAEARVKARFAVGGEEEEPMDLDDDEDVMEEHSAYGRPVPYPYQRYGHTVCAYNGRAYLWGGRNDEFGASNTLHEFDPATQKWRIVPVSGKVPPSRDGHSATVVGHKMYLFGGFEEDVQRFSQDTYVFDFLQSRWSQMRTTGSPPVWRDFHTAVIIDEKMYVFGGRSDQMGQFHSTKDVYCDRLKVLDLNSGEWSDPIVKGTKPGGRRSHSAWAHNGRMYIFGGFLGTLNHHYNDMYCFDPATNQWEKIVGTCAGSVTRPSPRRRQCTVVVNDRLFLFGGTKPNLSTTAGAGLADLADLYVFDYAPSLFNLSAHAVLKYHLDEPLHDYLPRDVCRALDSLSTPNAITNLPPGRSVAG